MSDERRLLGCHTPCVNMPGYINVSQHPNGDVEIMVRGPAEAHPSKRFQDYGPTASLRMSAEEFCAVLRDIVRTVRT